MLPDAKTFWRSVAFLLVCSIVVIAIGHVWIGVAALVLIALAVVMFFVRKSKGQIPDTRFAEPPAPAFAAPAPPEIPAREALSDEGLAEAERLLHALHDAGIIAPDMPEVAQLQEALADYGEPVDVVAVLSALLEAPYYHAAFAGDRHFANLRFHAEQVEQFAENFHEDMEDLCHLAQYADWDMHHAHCEAPKNGEMRCVLQARIGTQSIDMDEFFFSKYRNAHFYVRIAKALVAAGAPRRLAWLYDDSGIWLTGLPPQADLGMLPEWQWVDEAEA